MPSDHPEQPLEALYRDALAAAGTDRALAATLLERRLRLRRPEDVFAREAYHALDETLYEQLAAEACDTLGPEAGQEQYRRWIRERLASMLTSEA